MFRKRESGYTLIEMIITIGLISIAIGLSSFGLSVIYNSNVSAYASRIVSDIKLVQTKEMASNDLDYRMFLSHDGTHYTVDVQVKQPAGVWTDFKNYELPRAMVLSKYSLGSPVPIDDPVFDTDADLTFEFDVSSGKLLNGSGFGRYQISASSSDRIIEFVVIEQNGRVYIDE